MYTKAGVGMSHHRNPMMAGREAVEMALKDGLREYGAKISQVLQKSPEDKASRIYLERSALYMVKGVPEDWTGVETLTKK